MGWLDQPKVESPPDCYGLSWDRNAPECVGGPNAAYRNRETGGRVHERCLHFDACGRSFALREKIKSQAQAQVQAPQTSNVVPISQVMRPPYARPMTTPTAPSPPPQPAAASSPVTGITPYQAQKLLEQLLAVAKGSQTQKTPQAPQPPPQPPAGGYQQAMPVNFYIPQYLTVREHRRPGEGIFRMLGRELFRSVGKSMGHTLGNFFDTTPFVAGEDDR